MSDEKQFAYAVVTEYDRATKSTRLAVRGYEIARVTATKAWFSEGEQPLPFGCRTGVPIAEWCKTPQAALERFVRLRGADLDRHMALAVEARRDRDWAAAQLPLDVVERCAYPEVK